jgi:hypothetical protein
MQSDFGKVRIPHNIGIEIHALDYACLLDS